MIDLPVFGLWRRPRLPTELRRQQLGVATTLELRLGCAILLERAGGAAIGETKRRQRRASRAREKPNVTRRTQAVSVKPRAAVAAVFEGRQWPERPFAKPFTEGGGSSRDLSGAFREAPSGTFVLTKRRAGDSNPQPLSRHLISSPLKKREKPRKNDALTNICPVGLSSVVKTRWTQRRLKLIKNA